MHHTNVFLAASLIPDQCLYIDRDAPNPHEQLDWNSDRSDSKTSLFPSACSNGDIAQGPNEPAPISRPLVRTQDPGRDASENLLRLARPDSSEPQPADIERQLRKALSAIRKNRPHRLSELDSYFEHLGRNSFAGQKHLLNRILIASALRGQADWLQKSLQWGADVDATATTRVYFGQTALMLAARKGEMNLIRTLLEHGASIDKLDVASGRWHPMLIAAYCLQYDALLLLVNSKQISTDYPNEMGWTALKMVLETKNCRRLDTEQSLRRLEIIKFLVQQKASPLAECESDYGFADMLAHHQHPLAYHSAEYSDVEGEISYPSNAASPLEIAVQDDHAALEAILLGNPDWVPQVMAAPFFLVLENFISTSEGAKAKYLAFRENYAKDPENGHKLARAYMAMKIND
ncbi:MAG: ankyrin repeat domain-containing protein [Burkholderiaceae bacterium]